MPRCAARAVLAASLSLALVAPLPALADNPMGYRLLMPGQVATLSGHGSLGLRVGPGRRIDEAGLHFGTIEVRGVTPGSAGARAGLRVGDQIVAMDGWVFADARAFAAYLGSKPPGARISMDTIPAGSGPAQARRIAITLDPATAP